MQHFDEKTSSKKEDKEKIELIVDLFGTRSTVCLEIYQINNELYTQKKILEILHDTIKIKTSPEQSTKRITVIIDKLDQLLKTAITEEKENDLEETNHKLHHSPFTHRKEFIISKPVLSVKTIKLFKEKLMRNIFSHYDIYVMNTLPAIENFIQNQNNDNAYLFIIKEDAQSVQLFHIYKQNDAHFTELEVEYNASLSQQLSKISEIHLNQHKPLVNAPDELWNAVMSNPGHEFSDLSKRHLSFNDQKITDMFAEFTEKSKQLQNDTIFFSKHRAQFASHLQDVQLHLDNVRLEVEQPSLQELESIKKNLSSNIIEAELQLSHIQEKRQSTGKSLRELKEKIAQLKTAKKACTERNTNNLNQIQQEINATKTKIENERTIIETINEKIKLKENAVIDLNRKLNETERKIFNCNDPRRKTKFKEIEKKYQEHSYEILRHFPKEKNVIRLKELKDDYRKYKKSNDQLVDLMLDIKRSETNLLAHQPSDQKHHKRKFASSHPAVLTQSMPGSVLKQYLHDNIEDHKSHSLGTEKGDNHKANVNTSSIVDHSRILTQNSSTASTSSSTSPATPSTSHTQQQVDSQLRKSKNKTAALRRPITPRHEDTEHDLDDQTVSNLTTRHDHGSSSDSSEEKIQKRARRASSGKQPLIKQPAYHSININSLPDAITNMHGSHSTTTETTITERPRSSSSPKMAFEPTNTLSYSSMPASRRHALVNDEIKVQQPTISQRSHSPRRSSSGQEAQKIDSPGTMRVRKISLFTKDGLEKIAAESLKADTPRSRELQRRKSSPTFSSSSAES